MKEGQKQVTDEYGERTSVVIKNNKYLTGWGYALGKRRYRWSKEIKDAYLFHELHSDADYHAGVTHAKVMSIKKLKLNE